ncbi:MAG: DUF4395 domain-containing protein, partial [Leadbetterella sp.]|nr:DUF4395 domain-containing protein [Leadbetterella sp.]
PVDLLKIDGNVARTTAFLVVILIVLFLFSGLWYIPAFLLIDFTLRAIPYSKLSPLALLGKSVNSLLKIPAKPTDRAPKVFAARIGLVFSAGILLSAVFRFPDLAFVLAAVLLIFAFLESVFGFCAACTLYPYWKNLTSS